MRNAECGVRNGQATVRFRIPHSAFRITLLPLLACNPTTTRPPFSPHPQAPFTWVDAPPATVAAAAAEWLETKGVRVAYVSQVDAFVETAWYDAERGQSLAGSGWSGGPLATVRLRVWADPGPPGASRVTVEPVYRPMRDPSLPPRDVEVLVPNGHAGAALAQELLAALVERFGIPPQYRR